MKIQVLVEMPPPEKSKYPSKEEAQGSVEDQVREALDCIESGRDSHTEWRMINKVYNALQKKSPKNKRVKNLLAMIEPVLAKYGQFGVAEKEG